MVPSPPRLSNAARRHLRGLAHPLEPVVRVGQHGLTAAVVAEVDGQLAEHELIKIRLAGDRGEKAEQARELAERTGAAEVGRIGHLVILYRRQSDPELRRIELPAATGTAAGTGS